MPLDKEQNREYQREWMRQKRAREKAMKEIGQVTPAETPEVAEAERTALSPTYITPINLQDTLRRRRGRAKLKQTDGERLGDGLPDTSELVAAMPQAAQDALLEGMRTNSPEPWKRYKASLTK